MSQLPEPPPNNYQVTSAGGSNAYAAVDGASSMQSFANAGGSIRDQMAKQVQEQRRQRMGGMYGSVRPRDRAPLTAPKDASFPTAVSYASSEAAKEERRRRRMAESSMYRYGSVRPRDRVPPSMEDDVLRQGSKSYDGRYAMGRERQMYTQEGRNRRLDVRSPYGSGGVAPMVPPGVRVYGTRGYGDRGYGGRGYGDRGYDDGWGPSINPDVMRMASPESNARLEQLRYEANVASADVDAASEMAAAAEDVLMSAREAQNIAIAAVKAAERAAQRLPAAASGISSLLQRFLPR